MQHVEAVRQTGEESESNVRLSSKFDCVGTSDEEDEKNLRFQVILSCKQDFYFLSAQQLLCLEKIDEAASKSALAHFITVDG